MNLKELVDYATARRLDGGMEVVVRIETGAVVPIQSLAVKDVPHLGGPCLLVSHAEVAE